MVFRAYYQQKVNLLRRIRFLADKKYYYDLTVQRPFFFLILYKKDSVLFFLSRLFLGFFLDYFWQIGLCRKKGEKKKTKGKKRAPKKTPFRKKKGAFKKKKEGRLKGAEKKKRPSEKEGRFIKKIKKGV